MVFLGFGKYVRADRIYALEPITGEERGSGRRTLVWVDGIVAPVVASRTQETILEEMGAEPEGERSGRGRRRAWPAASCSPTTLDARAASRRWRSRRSARRLLGCTLRRDGVGGVICEVEAYAPEDAASHAYRGRTARNGSMFGPAGNALRLSLVRDPLVRERHLRAGGPARGPAPASARAATASRRCVSAAE